MFKINTSYVNHAFAGNPALKAVDRSRTAPSQATLSRRDLQRIVAEMVG